jgi:hypothetical protein
MCYAIDRLRWFELAPGCNNFVISTGAYPDFLFAALPTTTYAALRKERRKNLINATRSRQEMRGSVVERSAAVFPRQIPCKRCNPVIGPDV